MTVLAAAGLALLAGCAASAPQPPSATALARKLGCTTLSQGLGFAAYDVKQDIDLQGAGPACQGAEIYTFPTAKAQADWLHQAAGSAGQSDGYAFLAVGNLWVIYPGNMTALAAVIKTVGGKEVTF